MAVSDSLIDTLFDGRYRIQRKLGAGGMADVYLAEDQELGRRVAIKILNGRHANDDQFIERFRREAKNAAALNHPNIVSIYDRGERRGHLLHRDGVPRRPHAQGAHRRPRRRADQRRDRVRAPDPLGAALRAPARHRASGHQAAQRPRRRRGAREGDGLRHRARRDEPDDRDGLDRRDGAVPLARAGPGRRGRPALGSLLARDRPLRAADRQDAVRRRDAGRDRDEAPLERAEAAVQATARHPARARHGRLAGARQEPGRPLPERGRDGGRPRARRAWRARLGDHVRHRDAGAPPPGGGSGGGLGDGRDDDRDAALYGSRRRPAHGGRGRGGVRRGRRRAAAVAVARRGRLRHRGDHRRLLRLPGALRLEGDGAGQQLCERAAVARRAADPCGAPRPGGEEGAEREVQARASSSSRIRAQARSWRRAARSRSGSRPGRRR